MAVPVFSLRLIGPIQLLNRDGVDLLDGNCGEKTKGLLALLAVYGDRPCSRAMLQDKLWSDRGQKQGRDSLKQALTQLRKAFGQHASAIIRSTGGPVLFDRALVSVDIFSAPKEPCRHTGMPPREFLEGIDIADPQFDHWLATMRTSMLDEDAPGRNLASAGSVTRSNQPISIGLFPVKTEEGDIKSELFAGLLLDRVTTGIRHFELFEIHDFRDVSGTGDRSCDLVLNCQAVRLGTSVAISFGLRRISDQLLVWSRQVVLETANLSGARLPEITAELIDQIIDRVFKIDIGIGSARHEAARKVIGGIDRLLRRSVPTVDQAERDLAEACELYPSSTFHAWRAYAIAHRLESGESCIKELRAKADAFSAKAIEADPHNPLTRTLLTHVYGFIMHDFDRAAALIEPLQSDEPNLPLYHYAKGFLHVYKGEYDTAKNAANRAMQMGRFSPYNYLFSCLSLAASSMKGDYEAAIRMGQKSLTQHSPGTNLFAPTIRYFAASSAMAGDNARAGELFGLLVQSSPNFSVEKIDEPGAPFPSDDIRRFVRTGLTRAEKVFERNTLQSNGSQ